MTVSADVIKSFCSKEQCRTDRAFNVNGFTYATDGRIAIKIPALAEFEGHPSPPDIERVWFRGTTTDADYQPVPSIKKEFITEPCEECDGKGLVKKCPECDGNGLVYWESDRGYEYDDVCGMCGGNGSVKGVGIEFSCENCNGTGQTVRTAFTELGSKIISCPLIAKIAALPNARIATEVTTGFAPIPFAFDGGEGVVMPARREFNEHIYPLADVIETEAPSEQN